MTVVTRDKSNWYFKKFPPNFYRSQQMRIWILMLRFKGSNIFYVCLTGVVGRRTAPNVLEKSNFGLGDVIGAAIIGCVFTITLCVAAICFVNRRKKQFDVSKMGDNSLNETGNDNRYSTLPARENVELLKNSGTPGIKDKNRNSSKKTPSPLKIMFEKRKKRYPVNSYREEEV